MKQTILTIKKQLERKKERLSRQEDRLNRMKDIISNAKIDIEQMEYTLKELQHFYKGECKQRTIANKDIGDFFTRLSNLFDALQHRYHVHFNYKLACLIIHSRYRFRSRVRASGKKYLSEATILTYFKYERNASGITIPR